MPSPKPISPAEAAALVEHGATLVDIREPGEVAQSSIPGALNLPLSRLESPTPALPKDTPVVFLCRSGARTQMNAPRLAARAGANPAYLLTGGIMAWKAAGLPVTEQPSAGSDPFASIRRTVSALFGGNRG